MRLLSRLIVIIVLSNSIIAVNSQDIIYTVSGEYNDERIALDSILF